MEQTIVTLTMNPTIDKSTQVHHVVPEQKLRCEPPRHEPGGGGLNVSRAIQRLGARARAVYPVGGHTGELLKMLLDQEGIDHQPLSIEGTTRQNLMVLDESADSQFRFGMPGPELDREAWQRCLDALGEVDPVPSYVVASGSLPPGAPDDFYGRVADVGHEMGSRVVVDTSGDALRHAADAGLYLLKPNMRELGQLAGHEIQDEKDQEAEARRLIDRGAAQVVVVTLGAAGALLVSEDYTKRMRSPTVPIRSKIGAGDSTVAGIVLALCRGLDLVDAVRFGMAAGAAAVMTPGTELCRREDTERLYERIRAEAQGEPA